MNTASSDPTGTGSPPPPRWWEIAAPPFFVGFVLLRSWLEMTVFSATDRFSYYTALHHLCWYTSTMVAILLAVHLASRLPMRTVLPLLYGIVVAVIPLLWSLTTGEPLSLEYLRGSPREILTQIATFSIASPRNWPLVPEVMLIDLGMIAVAWRLTRCWWRGLAAGIATHLTLAVIGLPWFGLSNARATIISVDTALGRSQSVQAAGWMFVATALVGVAAWRLGAFADNRRSWVFAALIGAEVWLVWSITAQLAGWFRTPFDLFVTGLPMAWMGCLASRLAFPDRRKVGWPTIATWFLVFAVQAAVIIPFIGGFEQSLYRHRTIRWHRPRATAILPPAATTPVQSFFSGREFRHS